MRTGPEVKWAVGLAVAVLVPAFAIYLLVQAVRFVFAIMGWW